MHHQLISRNVTKLVSAFTFVLMTAVTATAQADPPAVPEIIPPSGTIHGMTYGEWGAAWWQWAASVPEPNNPVLDTTGDDAAAGQHGPVWFLAGNFGGVSERTVHVPLGKRVFFPVVTSFVNSLFCVDPDDSYSATEMAAYLDEALDTATDLYFDVDNVPVTNFTSYRAASGAFQVTVPADNVWSDHFNCADVTAGTYAPNVADGIWIMLDHFSMGEHTIHFGGEIPYFGFSMDITYHITVP